MKIIASFVVILIFLGCGGMETSTIKKSKTVKIIKTDAEWKKILTPLQYRVLRESETEIAFTSELNNNYKKGDYVCAACKTVLYKSKHKYDSGSGWPSFDRAVKNSVKLDVDFDIGYARTELKCNTCNGHLGHSFDDGPIETTGKRHCINGAALLFIPKK